MQKRTRSFANFLAVKKMAGILVGDADWKRFQSCGETDSNKEFGDVASSCREHAGLGEFGFVW